MRIALCVSCILLLAMPAAAQRGLTTQTGTASKGSNTIYSFTSNVSGQVTATLSWDTPSANLLVILVCGGTEALTYGAGAGLLDRVARLEAGVPGGQPCAIGVSSVDESASFRLHVVRSGDQTLTPQSATGFVALTEARAGTLVSDGAVRALDRLRNAAR